MKNLAHVMQESSPFGEWKEHDLVEHLSQVALQARVFADKFQSGDWAYAAGIWHDLGKFSMEFQLYLRSKSGFDSEAMEDAPGTVDHSTAGALHAVSRFKGYGKILAYVIAGHHAGLPDWEKQDEPGGALSDRLSKTELLEKVPLKELPPHLLEITLPSLTFKTPHASLWIRMLFSCLVDADFLDTERFMDIDKYGLRSGYPSLKELQGSYNNFMASKTSSAEETKVNFYRKEILQQCLKMGLSDPGIFSLTVPTGGGKTLSSMAFALEHALKHGKSRIIYVIPFTSIIEQTADIYRDIFGDVVIEHHSNVCEEKQDENPNFKKNRIAAENWDAPIIVTTNVQFFESLFAAKTSRTRKLHNIINSVVIFDEAQQLPPDFLTPILNVIQELADRYKVSFVFATATQPALKERNDSINPFKGLKKVTEIISDVSSVYNALRRVDFDMPGNSSPKSWEEISSELQKHEQVLCIVNTRKDCRDLFDLMPKGTIHLSALMCGEHRSQVVREIKRKLLRKEPIRVVSTQLVEAGVDIDFPIVFRALTGLDSIAQAAGRCNREGKLDRGKVFVFIPPKPSPPGPLKKAEESARTLMKLGLGDPLDHETYVRYFNNLYGKSNLDKAEIEDLLNKDVRDISIQFRTAARRFQIIDDSKYASVIVRFGKSKELVDQIVNQRLNKFLLRKLQRYTITIPKQKHAQLLKQGRIQQIGDTGIFVQSAVDSIYDPVKGFLIEDPLDPEDFMC